MTMISTLNPVLARTHPLAVLLSGNAGVAAHIIGAEQFGIAASFAIVVSAVEMATTLGAQQLVVREHDGDTPAFQAWLHSVQLVRGLLGGLLIFACASPVALFLQVPDAIWAFQWLAVIPLLPAAFALLLIWPLQHKLPDFRLLLVLAIIHATGVLVMSHPSP